MSEERYLNPPEAAARLGITDKTIRRYIKRGVFKDVVIRGMLKPRYFIPEREVERVRVEGGFEHNVGNKYAPTVSA
jgi:predicted site-specific integrase-resolvase